MMNRVAQFGELPMASGPCPEYIDGKPAILTASDMYGVVHDAKEFARRYHAALQYADVMIHDPRQNPDSN